VLWLRRVYDLEIPPRKKGEVLRFLYGLERWRPRKPLERDGYIYLWLKESTMADILGLPRPDDASTAGARRVRRRRLLKRLGEVVDSLSEAMKSFGGMLLDIERIGESNWFCIRLHRSWLARPYVLVPLYTSDKCRPPRNPLDFLLLFAVGLEAGRRHKGWAVVKVSELERLTGLKGRSLRAVRARLRRLGILVESPWPKDGRFIAMRLATPEEAMDKWISNLGSEGK